MITKSYSQSGQDRFVDLILEGKRDGTFIDCGCNHPIELSNTFSLEKELGWRGLLADNDKYCVDLCQAQRLSPAILVDSTKENLHYRLGLAMGWKDRDMELPVDYLSLDCESATTPALEILLKNMLSRFRVMTVETDLYRFGPEPRDAIHALLERHGYDILCQNVRSSEGLIYESWAVDPKLVNMEKAERFRSNHLKWSEILALGEKP